MSQSPDSWYVRLPDGQILRAGSTAALRHHLEQGDVPLESRVRRSPLDRWSSLDTVEQFADLAVFSLGRARRANGPRPERQMRGTLPLQTVGVRGLVRDLTTALDSALVRAKLVVAALTGLVVGLVLAAGHIVPQFLEPAWAPFVWAGQGLVLLIAAVVSTAILSEMTYVELAHLRSARWLDIRTGLAGNVLRLLCLYLLVIGGVLAATLYLQWLPEWLLNPGDAPWVAAAAATRLVLEVVLWPLVGFSLLFGPVVVVEQLPLGKALRQWLGLLRANLSRAVLYEALALAVAVVASLPFIIPVELGAWGAPHAGVPGVAVRATLGLLRGLALSPAIAYLLVANVYIYLALRYEHQSVQ